MIGSLLNQRYQISARLGEGGMGTVYRAHDILLERDVAVKVMSTTSLDTKGHARLMREARATAKLNHPNIVSVHDAGETAPLTSSGQAALFIVMELVEGRSLYDASPQMMAEHALRVAALGARIIGSCCGSTADHIRAMGEAIRAQFG